jgi:hypothetical protein
MLRLPDKLLAILLSLLLGLAPLQGVMGMTGGSSGQQAADQQSAHRHVNDMPRSMQQKKPTVCPHCLSHDCCQGHQGHSPSSHCSGCLVALPVVITLSAMNTGGSTYPQPQFRYAQRLHSAIHRPPKV